jgi:Protein of unknown function (DUF3309)
MQLEVSYSRVGSLEAARRKSNHDQPILLIILLLGVIGALPTWPHSRSWGYYPSGGLGLVLVILLILLLMGRL